MGSLMLDCPLCCGKTFSCQKTLKYHLLSLTNNLFCPGCSVSFDSIHLLAEHLGDSCETLQEKNKHNLLTETSVDFEPKSIDSSQSKVNQIEKNRIDSNNLSNMNLSLSEDEEVLDDQVSSGLDEQENLKVCKSNTFLSENKANEMEQTITVKFKKEQYVEDMVSNLEVRLVDDGSEGSILILSNSDQGRIISNSDQDHIISNEEELIENAGVLETIDSADDEIVEEHLEDAQETEELYSCNSCGVSFTSVIEHIQNYHNDQEVVVEMADEETGIGETFGDVALLEVLHNTDEENEDDNGETTENILIENSPHETKRIIMESGNIVTAASIESTGERWRNPQILNTLREEQCVDRGGRWYTRKVVQIERFWDTAAVKDEDESPEGLSTDGSDGKLFKIEDAEGNEINQDGYLEGGVGVELDEETIASRIYHCTRCFMHFLTMPEFESHVCTPSVGKYKCDHCSVSYGNSKSLCAHMKVHKNLKPADKRTASGNDESANRLVGPFKCSICDTVFPSNKSLRLHRRMHDPVRVRPVEAPVEYGAAAVEEGSEMTDRFHCSICDKWIHVGYRTIHAAVHTGETEYNCEICNRKFHTKENLAMHMNVHTTGKVSSARSDKLLPYECNFCNRQFARPHEKVKHERIHTGEKPHSCDICGKSFRVSYCLTLHMRTHTGARPYVCEHCGKRFKAHSVYNHHLLTHSDIRAYKCPFCPKAFKTSVQLAGHKNSHTKPFSCTECNRPFASLYAVRVHMETHKRQNNLKFNCQLCGASYARAFALRDHLRAQHFVAEMDKDSEPEANVAALSIIPKSENNVEMEKLVMADSDEDMAMVE